MIALTRIIRQQSRGPCKHTKVDARSAPVVFTVIAFAKRVMKDVKRITSMRLTRTSLSSQAKRLFSKMARRIKAHPY